MSIITADIKQTDGSKILKEAFYTIRELRKRLEETEKDGAEPIAVIGTACRFPGGCSTPEAFWRLLKKGKDGLRPIPTGRWNAGDFYHPEPGTPGKMYVREAGFLHEDIGEMDARFFGISPREAVEMDPQHRLLLEVSWEALERSGQAPDRLKGSQTGVFIGILGGSEYGTIPRLHDESNPYSGTGLATNTASGRISHILGFHGPALSVDTACSSSLVALHLACQALAQRECDAALAGGVGLMLTPYTFLMLCNFRALSRDGRCKTFDSAADGYGRGEGCGMALLKRLADARRDGDPILAVIKGSAVNHDGPGSGLTVPNGLAQQALYRKALERARVLPQDVGYLETHGTGTELGDPIEMHSIGEVFGAGNARENPLAVGAVKANIGHLEAAAGIAGLIKTILCLQHKEIPPQINLNTINPKIHPAKIPAVIPQENMPWKAGGKARTAGVSSFGFSGTNAHIVVSEPPPPPPTASHALERPLHILALSAKNDAALAELITRYKDYLAGHTGGNIQDICYTANAGRSHFACRAAFIAPDINGMLGMMDNGGTVSQGRLEEGARPKIAFLFGGALSSDMVESAVLLYGTQPVFRQSLKTCEELFEPYTGPLDEGTPEAYLFSIEYGLLRTWESWGVKPSAVMGKQTGALVAACAAGIMTVETAVKYVLEQGHSSVGDGTLSLPRIRFVSGKSGLLEDKKELTSPGYWQKQTAAPAAFNKGVETLLRQDFRLFLEIGHGSGFTAGNNEACMLKTGGKPWEALLRNLAHLYCSGVDVDWQGFERGYDRQKKILPTYPFQRRRYWVEALPYAQLYTSNPPGAPGEQKASRHAGRPIIMTAIVSPLPDRQFEFRITRERIPEIFDNIGTLHVGYYQEMLANAMEELYGNVPYTITGIDFLSGLALDDAVARPIYLAVTPEEHEKMEFRFYTRDSSQRFWTMHARGGIHLNERPAFPPLSIEKKQDIQLRCTERYTAADFYGMMEIRGFILGPALKWIDRVWYRDGEALARFRSPLEPEKNRGFLTLFPGIWDACAQLFFAAFSSRIDDDSPFMIIRWQDFAFHLGNLDGCSDELWCHAVLNENPGPNGVVKGEFTLFNKKGDWVCRSQECCLKELNKDMIETLKQWRQDARAPRQGEKNRGLPAFFYDAYGEKKKDALSAYLREKIALLLGMPPGELDVNEPLRNLGMDSLIAVDYKKTVEQDLPVDIPIETLVQGPSVSQLSGALAELLEEEGSQANGNDGQETGAAGYKLTPGLWLGNRVFPGKAGLRLFCLPYGGGGASIYDGWQEMLPNAVDVVPIQLPGRENRIWEPPIANLQEMVEVLEKILLPRLDRPFAFYGHSFGALVAYGLSHRLWKGSQPRPLHLFAGGYSSPSICPNPFLNRVRANFQTLGLPGIPAPGDIPNLPIDRRIELLETVPELKHIAGKLDDALLKAVLPMLLADIKVVESFVHEGDDAFDIPVTAFHGDTDDRVGKDEMQAWQELTTAAFHLHVLPGDHFFLHKDQSSKELLSIISRELEIYLNSCQKEEI